MVTTLNTQILYRPIQTKTGKPKKEWNKPKCRNITCLFTKEKYDADIICSTNYTTFPSLQHSVDKIRCNKMLETHDFCLIWLHVILSVLVL